MHPVKILSDPLGGKEFAKRESVVINLGDPNGETNPQQLSIMLFARTAEIDRVRSIHRTALLSPLSPPPSAFRLEAPIGGRYRHKPVQIIRVSLARMSGADRPESIQIEKSRESGGGGEKFDSLVAERISI